MKELHFSTKREEVRGVSKLIKSAGNKIVSVWFKKRTDGKLRKMAFRLHVTAPTYEKKPEGKIKFRTTKDAEKDLLTVFDVNHVRYNKKGYMNGRGGYKCIPLDSVVRIKVGGVIYRIV